jgi:hypothetical protein
MIRSRFALRFKRSTSMPLLWACLALLFHMVPGGVAPAQAQGSRKDDIVFNSRGVPLAGAGVRVCTQPASAPPCTPLALIYSDPALTQALANPTTTDGLGNYFFYAAPGKYTIEISGPGITTKQIPDVIIPLDPSNASFSGNISAFSLSLGGNLSVTGNTTVIGSMASGTLNLSNQPTPPGAATAGSVNLYTKTADKRLYYKDDTGTEIGPIASSSGAQTNAINTFTATQNFDSDVENKGPNPSFSLARYGGYSSSTSSPPSTTGSITSSTTTLTLAAAQDFANGQGIVVYKAGPSPTVTTPGQPTVTPINLLNGTTTYNYRAIAEDRNGALTAAGTAGTTTTGATTIGANTVTLTTCVRTNGIATYTSSSAHNLQSGAQINIEGFSGGVFDSCNGVKTIASTPTGTTFTTNDGPLGNESNTTGSPTAVVYACNTLTFPSGSYSGNNTIHYWIYRSTGGGSFSLVGVAQGVDPWWQDCGLPAPNAPAYVPSTPPGSTQPGYLATTIVSGGGTTTLTLANAATTSATSQTVLHDNSVPLKNAIQAAYTAGGGTVYIPNILQNWLFNSTLDFTTGLSVPGSLVVRLHLNSNLVFLNQPWLLRAGMDIEGEPHVITSFSYVNGAQMIANTAYPMIILPEYGLVTSVHFNRLMLTGNQSQQSVVLADSGSDGGGISGLVFDDVNFSANAVSTPVVLKGGFDFFFNRGNCQGGAASFVPQSCLQLTNASPAVTGSSPAQVPGRVKVNGLYFAGNAIDIDCLPDGTNVAPIDFTFSTTIFESAVAPYVRFNCPTGIFNGIVMDDVVQADSIVGLGTPSIDAQNDASIGSVLWKGGAVNAPQQPAFITSANVPSLLLINAPFTNPGNTPNTNLGGGGMVSTGIIAASGAGRVETFMAAPTGPSVAVSSGGNVPIGTIPYRLQWVDVDGNYSPISPIVNAVTTSGNQTVTLTPPTPPAGAVFWVAYRSDSEVNNPPGGCATGYTPATSNYVDTVSFTCGQSERAATAGVSIVGPNGVSGPQLRLVNNGNTLTFLPTLTANRNVTIPDLSGVALVTGYVNSAFDNATRANGAIGSNWTVTNTNTINISSDNFIGAGANSVAYWNANAFNPSQFSQTTLTALNGTTDFPGVVTLMSGSGSGAQGYQCVEDTTNIFIQKIAGTVNTTLVSGTVSGAAGDILRLEAVPGAASTALTCYRNGVSALTFTDSSSPYLTGSPGLFMFGSVATASNWSGGNLHPFSQLDVESSWVKPQHLDGNAATCTMSAGTTCTATLTSAKWRGCIAQAQGTNITGGAVACNISGTTLTVTAAASNSNTWGILLF